MQLTERDRQILNLVHRHRFLRSSHITALIGGSEQQILRRLQLLYHHGFLERPRAQIDYYHRGGSRQIVYGLGNKGAGLLKRGLGLEYHQLDWPRQNLSTGRFFLEHALLVSDVLVALELACHASGNFRLLMPDAFPLPSAFKDKREPFHWSVNVSSRLKVGVIPDAVFALQSAEEPSNPAYFFLEADRGTMPITRSSLGKSSFYRKLLAYEATHSQKLHHRVLGMRRFRVLTVTADAGRARSLANAAAKFERRPGLFLFRHLTAFSQNPVFFMRSGCQWSHETSRSASE